MSSLASLIASLSNITNPSIKGSDNILNNIDQLLSGNFEAQAQPQTPVQGDPSQAIQGTPITVNGQTSTPQPAQEEAPSHSLGNVLAIQERDQAIKNSQDAADHQGMFHTKGTLRDVLGLLGDAFLVQGGRNRIYAPAREQEKASDALAGYTQNPQAYMDAAERVSAIDPEMGLKMATQAQAQQLGQQKNLIDAMRAQQGSRHDAAADYKTGIGLWAQYSGALAKNPKLGQNPQFLQAMQEIKDQYGLGDGYDLPAQGENLDTGLYSGYQFGGTPPPAQIQVPFRERAAAAAEKNAEAHMINARRPPAGRAAPNPTSASIAAPILRKIQNGKPITPGEEEILTRTGYGESLKGRGSTRKSGQSGPPGVAPGQFKVLGSRPSN